MMSLLGAASAPSSLPGPQTSHSRCSHTPSARLRPLSSAPPGGTRPSPRSPGTRWRRASAAGGAGGAGNVARPLEGRVALVTGGSRGVGRGIAQGLGEQGATVYVTGRSAVEPATPGAGGGGNITATCADITARGGVGIPVQCDHSNDAEDRIEAEHGRLDLLVNNAFFLPDDMPVKGNFWEQGAGMWDAVCNVGLRSHYMASCFAVPLLRRAAGGRGVIVNVSSFGGMGYTFNVAYGVGKAGVDRLAADMAVELTEEGIASVSLWPGVVSTDRILNWAESEEGKDTFDLTQAETPLLAGRAVAALAGDDAIMSKTGRVLIVAELAGEYGFSEDDGSVPPSIRSLRFLIPYLLKGRSPPPAMIPDWRLPIWLLAQGKGQASPS